MRPEVGDVVHYVGKKSGEKDSHLAAIVVGILDSTNAPVVNLLVLSVKGVDAVRAVTFDGGTQVRGTWHERHIDHPEPLILDTHTPAPSAMPVETTEDGDPTTVRGDAPSLPLHPSVPGAPVEKDDAA